jgi:S1-C subfamily serine protease
VHRPSIQVGIEGYRCSLAYIKSHTLLFRTTTPSGNSGGPLLDSSGKVIGMNTAIYSPSGASSGIGFAIPIDTVKFITETLLRDGQGTSIKSLSHGRLGRRFVSNRDLAFQ